MPSLCLRSTPLVTSGQNNLGLRILIDANVEETLEQDAATGDQRQN